MTIVIPRPPFDTGIDIVLASARQMELAAQRNITHAFIMANPIELTLTPHSMVTTATGGRTRTAGSPRATQTFRLIEAEGRYTPTRALDGVERKYDFELLGEYDAVVAVGDTFTYDGQVFEVIEMMPDLQYEVRAAVTAHG